MHCTIKTVWKVVLGDIFLWETSSTKANFGTYQSQMKSTQRRRRRNSIFRRGRRWRNASNYLESSYKERKQIALRGKSDGISTLWRKWKRENSTIFIPIFKFKLLNCKMFAWYFKTKVNQLHFCTQMEAIVCKT